MVLHRARPGVQHGEDAERAADPRAIGGERVDGGRGFAEEHGVDHGLVGTREGTEFARQRKGQSGVVAGEQARAEALEPVLRPILLARRAMPVATRVIRVLERAAVVTAMERAAHRRGATAGDVGHRATVRRQHPPRVRLHIRGARGANDVREGQHGSASVRGALRGAASSR